MKGHVAEHLRSRELVTLRYHSALFNSSFRMLNELNHIFVVTTLVWIALQSGDIAGANCDTRDLARNPDHSYLWPCDDLPGILSAREAFQNNFTEEVWRAIQADCAIFTDASDLFLLAAGMFFSICVLVLINRVCDRWDHVATRVRKGLHTYHALTHCIDTPLVVSLMSLVINLFVFGVTIALGQPRGAFEGYRVVGGTAVRQACNWDYSVWFFFRCILGAASIFTFFSLTMTLISIMVYVRGRSALLQMIEALGVSDSYSTYEQIRAQVHLGIVKPHEEALNVSSRTGVRLDEFKQGVLRVEPDTEEPVEMNQVGNDEATREIIQQMEALVLRYRRRQHRFASEPDLGEPQEWLL